MEETVQNTSQNSEKTEKIRKALDVLMAVLLALSALGMAWATWMSQLHGSNEAQNYATSAALRAKGSSMTNASSLELTSALSIWNDLVALDAQRKLYESVGETSSAALCQSQIDYIILVTCDEDLEKRVREALAQDPVPNLFDAETVQGYYEEANSYLAAAEEAITEGNSDNLRSDAFAFVNVLYSLVLFLMAFMGLNKSQAIKNILLITGAVVFVIATVYMFNLPLPTGFDFWNYLQFLYS